MDGNSTFRHANTSVLSTVAIEAPVIVTSAELDAQLTPAYERLGLRPGLLEGLAGIHERRWWPEGITFADGAVQAGAKALAQAGIDSSQIGLMINSSVSRAHLEPSTAVEIHHKLGLPTSAINFDLANACLGFRQRHPHRRDDDRCRSHRLRAHRERRRRARKCRRTRSHGCAATQPRLPTSSASSPR